MSTEGTLVVTSRDVREIVLEVGVNRFMDELIDSLSEALRAYDESKTRIIKRAGFSYEHPHPGVLEWMPAMSAGHQGVLKVVAYNPSNPVARGLPTIVSTINLYDIATGRLVVLMDGVLPTALRTGAASAVATRVLAHPDSSVLGLVGCGAQAVTQLHAISRVVDVKRVLIYDIDPAASASFSDRVAFLGLPVEEVGREVLERESDVICTATSAGVGTGPVVDDGQFKRWVHVNAVGSDLPGKTELSAEFLRRSFVCPDFADQALVEGEAQQLAADDLGPPLNELLNGGDTVKAYRETSTVFDSTGFVVEDMVIAEIFLRHAAAMGLGSTLNIEGVDGDPKNPYAGLSPSAEEELRLAYSTSSPR